MKLEIVDQPVLPQKTLQLPGTLPDYTTADGMDATVEISIGSALIRISNDIEPTLLPLIIRSVGGASC